MRFRKFHIKYLEELDIPIESYKEWIKSRKLSIKDDHPKDIYNDSNESKEVINLLAEFIVSNCTCTQKRARIAKELKKFIPRKILLPLFNLSNYRYYSESCNCKSCNPNQ